MTKEECAIVTIYTGVAMLKGDDLEYLYRYAEKLMERPVFTHELAALADELKKRAKPDFINLCRWASAQPENADCIYCHEDSDGYVKPIEKNCHAFIRFGMDGWELSLKANGWHGSAKIRYCPMCGRDLFMK